MKKFTVKFRFNIKEKKLALELGKILYLIKSSYRPTLFYIKECDEIRNFLVGKNIELKNFEKIFLKKNKDLYENIKKIETDFYKLPIDIITYIIISFEITSYEIKTEINY